MYNWPDTVREALKELGGEVTLVPGAKLKQRVTHSLGGDSAVFDSFLAAEGAKFAEWLDTIEGIIVYRRVGTDMLVGFQGAAWPPQRTKGRVAKDRPVLRDDVYQALTQVDARGYFYSPDTDAFLVGPSEDPKAIPLPKVTLSHLIDERQAFTLAVENPGTRQVLQQSLDFSGNPLGAFQRAITECQLSAQWHTFKFDRLLSTLERWTGDNSLEIRPEWYDAQLEDSQESPQQILVRLIAYMSDEEIRNLPVPLHAVEQWYNLERRRRSRSS